MAQHVEEVRARVFLRSALPLVKIVAEDRASYRRLLRKAGGVLQFAAKDSEQAAYVELTDGGIDVVQGLHPSPSITMLFKTLKDLNSFFAGGTAVPAMQGPHGFFSVFAGLPTLMRVLPFLLKLKMLLPSVVPKDPDEKALKVKLLLYMASNALSQMNKGGDEVVSGFVKKAPERVFQWTVEGGGPTAYLRIRGGLSKAGRGTYERRRPYVHMIFPDIDGAFDVLTQTVGTVEAVASGRVKMEGAMEGGKDLGMLMQRVEALTTGQL
jgi:hypothetical protein